MVALALITPAPASAVAGKFRSGAPTNAKALIDVASDGAGTILLGYVPLTLSAHGYRISEIGAGAPREVLTARPLDPAFAAETTPDDRRMIEAIDAGVHNAQDAARARGLVAFKVLSDPGFARAAGLLRSIHANGSGLRRYRVEPLDGGAAALESAAVDPRVASAPVPAVAGLRAMPAAAGVEFTWDPPLRGGSAIVTSYVVERLDRGAVVPVAGRPVLASFGWKKGASLAHDPNPPYGSDVRYQVSAVDVLGRRSAAASLTVYATDVRALSAPHLSLRREPGRIVLDWEHPDGPMVAGYVVERSMQYGGPYEPLTRDGLPAKQKTYADSAIHPGSTYYYRVRDMDPRGTLGTPSLAATANLVSGNTAMDAPSGVTAQVTDAAHVRIAWSPVRDATGYTVQRSADGITWAQVNQNPVAITHADDRLAEHHPGSSLRYRVLAVRADSRFSAPSAAATVALTDTHQPGMPKITVSGVDADGVHLTLHPGADTQPGDALLVTRSMSPRVSGPVIASIRPTATTFVDTVPQWGERTSYHVIAATANGILSPISMPVTIRPERSLPTPPAPTVELSGTPARVVVHAVTAQGYGIVLDVDAGDGTRAFRRVTGPVFGEALVDARPQPGRRTYRIAYAQTNGRRGAFGPAVTIEVPKSGAARAGGSKN